MPAAVTYLTPLLVTILVEEALKTFSKRCSLNQSILRWGTHTGFSSARPATSPRLLLHNRAGPQERLQITATGRFQLLVFDFTASLYQYSVCVCGGGGCTFPLTYEGLSLDPQTSSPASSPWTNISVMRLTLVPSVCSALGQ